MLQTFGASSRFDRLPPDTSVNSQFVLTSMNANLLQYLFFEGDYASNILDLSEQVRLGQKTRAQAVDQLYLIFLMRPATSQEIAVLAQLEGDETQILRDLS